MSDPPPDETALGDYADDSGWADTEACEVALQRFFASAFQPGALLTHEWLQGALGVPDPSTMNSLESYRRWQFAYMGRIVAFQKSLLVSHNIALANVFGRGYRIVPPAEQSTWALREAQRDLRRALSKGVSRATHVNLAALSREERAAQVADLDRIRALREVVRKDETAAKMRARREGMGTGEWK